MTTHESRASAHATDVLVIDDENDIRELIELSLLRMGLGCDTAGSVGEARRLLDSRRYRLCLTDMRLPDGDGLELVEYIQNRLPGLPVAVITAFGSIETAIRALKLGAFDFVTKPIELKCLRELVTNALRSPAEPPPASSPNGRELVGRSAALAQLRAQVEKLARNQAPVFIQGESGTGKEVIARLIHSLGPRTAKPFVPVNCGAISPELMESEFFGHKKGSFTGATSDKQGLFQAANGGTLFLDEVADLPLPMQVKLLRAIQERAVRLVGGQEEEPVDVRILSASHRDLAQLVAENRFRQDLYFRINVIALRVPSLRERPEDIPDLATHILARLAGREGRAPRRLSRAALELLGQHPFPGNVRELENLLERACALCEGEEIGPQDIGLHPAEGPALVCPLPGYGTPDARDLSRAGVEPGTGGDERARMRRILDEAAWMRGAAARRLGLTDRQLSHRLRKWGLE